MTLLKHCSKCAASWRCLPSHCCFSDLQKTFVRRMSIKVLRILGVVVQSWGAQGNLDLCFLNEAVVWSAFLMCSVVNDAKIILIPCHAPLVSLQSGGYKHLKSQKAVNGFESFWHRLLFCFQWITKDWEQSTPLQMFHHRFWWAVCMPECGSETKSTAVRDTVIASVGVLSWLVEKKF